MKKVFLAIGVVTLLASCGGNATKTEEVKSDSTVVSVDSTHASVDTTKVDTTSVK
jgi:outer membrane lipopolysaccharide assembly protein LptE/RlpB